MRQCDICKQMGALEETGGYAGDFYHLRCVCEAYRDMRAVVKAIIISNETKPLLAVTYCRLTLKELTMLRNCLTWTDLELLDKKLASTNAPGSTI